MIRIENTRKHTINTSDLKIQMPTLKVDVLEFRANTKRYFSGQEIIGSSSRIYSRFLRECF